MLASGKTRDSEDQRQTKQQISRNAQCDGHSSEHKYPAQARHGLFAFQTG